jgi:4-amino-4-deoxy-L-arabinose transferase-like glycosyltransferase
VLGLVAFGAHAALATPLSTEQFPLMALQLQSMVAAGLAAVGLYRLVAAVHGRRVGAFAGLALAGATPIAVWSNVPKRHALSTLFVLFVLFAFYRARAADSVCGERRFRAAAYAATALFAWVHAPEAGIVVIALAAVDLPTARSNDYRSLGTIGAVFTVAALPFLLTNWLISGNPLLAPRFLPSVPEPGSPTGLSELLDDTAITGTGERASDALGREGESGPPDGGTGPGLTAEIARAVRRVVDGATIGLRDPDRLVDTFLRSGYVERTDAGATNLTVLESAPIVGALFALPVLAGRRLARGVDRPGEPSPERATDALAVVVAVLLTVLYLPSLPLRVQFSVRYLLPVYGLGVYGVVRLGVVRAVLRRAFSTLVWTVAGTVLIGSQLIVAWIGVANTGASQGTVLQFHAVLGIAAGVLLGAYVTIDAFGERGRRSEFNVRVGAVALGLSVGVGAVLVLLASLRYLGGDDLALPLLRHLAALLEAF